MTKYYRTKEKNHLKTQWEHKFLSKAICNIQKKTFVPSIRSHLNLNRSREQEERKLKWDEWDKTELQKNWKCETHRSSKEQSCISLRTNEQEMWKINLRNLARRQKWGTFFLRKEKVKIMKDRKWKIQLKECRGENENKLEPKWLTQLEIESCILDKFIANTLNDRTPKENNTTNT